MTWFRVDDGFGEHPKVDRLGADTAVALAVWLLCGNASARALTDGLVSEAMLSRSCSALSPTMRRRGVCALVTAGLWVERDDGWAFKDWLDHQPSREQVLAERAAARERQQRRREKAMGVTPTVGHAVTSPVSHTTPTRPDPTRPRSPTESVAREPEPGDLLAHFLTEHRRVLGKAAGSERQIREAWDGGGLRQLHGLVGEVKAILGWAESQDDPREALSLALEGFRDDPYASENGHRLGLFARGPGGFLGQPRALSSAPGTFAHLPPDHIPEILRD